MSLEAIHETFIDEFRRRSSDPSRGEPLWLTNLRKQGLAFFKKNGFPTTKHEEWRYTNIASLETIAERQDRSTGTRDFDREVIRPWIVPGCDLLVFVDGVFNGECSSSIFRSSMKTACPLSHALREFPERVQPVLTSSHATELNSFSALNAALWQEGAFVYVGANERASNAIQLLFVATEDSPTATHLRNLIVADKESELTVIETYMNLATNTHTANHLHNVVTELYLAEGATVSRIKVQRESSRAFHIATTQAQQKKESRFVDFSFAFGARLSRNEINTELSDERAHATFYGLYVANDEQHVDHHTAIDHVAAHCESMELYKGVLGGKAHGVFNGKVFVRKGAQKTDAKQRNQNLLLSRDAEIDTKPQLEIWADDVKCTHGATIGQIDEQALFYLRTRGIGDAEARQLLIYAFASEIVEKTPIPALRDQITELLNSAVPTESTCVR